MKTYYLQLYFKINMKTKIICLFAVLVCCSLAASPNRNCGRVKYSSQQKTRAALQPVQTAIIVVDDIELLPIHHYFSNF